MAKIHVEATYDIVEEPHEFTSSPNQTTRTVYLWSDKRSLFVPDQIWQVMKRASHYDDATRAGSTVATPFVELWRPTIDENPPAEIDDTWTEHYKSIEKERLTLEWHLSHKSLRLVWSQTEESLRAGKILVSAQQEIQRLGLPPLLLPTIDCNS